MATPSCTHPQHSYTPCAGAQASPLLGPGSRKPFPQIKIYHYTPNRYQKKHSPTDTNPDHQTSFINFLHLLRSIASSLFNLRAWQSFSTISLHSFVWGPLLRTPYISSPIHCLLFATHAHTIAACFSVISVLCHLFLISL